MSALATKSEFELRRIAGILGLIQGLVWTILSIICIALFIQDSFYPSVNSYIDTIGYYMYMFFLARQVEPLPNHALRPRVFFGFMWVYLALNILWLVYSSRLLNKSTSGMFLAKRIKSWAGLTFTISFLDLITVIILGADYHNCMSKSYISQEVCANGILPTLVIAAKGFVLWIINVIFAQVLYNMSRRLVTQQSYNAANLTTAPTMVQPPYTPQGYPPNATTPGSQYPQYQQHSQYPQYQQQMSYPRN